MEQSTDHMDNSHAGRPADATPDADNNLGRGAPDDRDERIQQKRHNEARPIERGPQYRNRQPHDLAREDVERHREGLAEEKPEFKREEQGRRAKRTVQRPTRGQ